MKAKWDRKVSTSLSLQVIFFFALIIVVACIIMVSQALTQIRSFDPYIEGFRI